MAAAKIQNCFNQDVTSSTTCRANLGAIIMESINLQRMDIDTTKPKGIDPFYLRLAKARMAICKEGIERSAKGNFGSYIPLQEIIPAILAAEAAFGLCSVFCIDRTEASVVIYDAHSDKFLRFSINIEHVFTSFCGEDRRKYDELTRNTGAMCTYLRRYAYMAAYNIVEHDTLEDTSTQSPPAATTSDKNSREAETSPAQISAAQLKYLTDLLRHADAKQIAAAYKQIGKNSDNTAIGSLSVSDAKQMIGYLREIVCMPPPTR